MSEPNAPQEPKPEDGAASQQPPAWGESQPPSTPQPDAGQPPAWGAPQQPPAQPPYGASGQQPPYGESPYGASGQQPPAQPPYGESPYSASPYDGSPYGAPPPPASAYPGSSDAGFPPPPGGGFPAPPPAFGYDGGGYTQPVDAGTALGWGWKKFWSNAGVVILAHLIWFVGIAIVVTILGFLVIFPLAGVQTADFDSGVNIQSSIGVVGIILISIVTYVLLFLSQIACINGYLAIADGRSVMLADFFTFRNVGNGVLVAIVVAIASGLLSFTGIGSLIVGFFTVYALYFVVDRNASFSDALSGSWNLAVKNVGATILIVLMVNLVAPLGAFICLVGLLVTMPWANLGVTYLYRRFTGGTVSAAV